MCVCVYACKITQARETGLTPQCRQCVGESVTDTEAERLRQRRIVREDAEPQTNLSAHFRHNGVENWQHLSPVHHTHMETHMHTHQKCEFGLLSC